MPGCGDSAHPAARPARAVLAAGSGLDAETQRGTFLGERGESMKEEVRVTWHPHRVDRRAREQLNGHRGCVVWFTGLSGSGKSTIANSVDQQLCQLGVHSFLLDGDNIRHGLM